MKKAPTFHALPKIAKLATFASFVSLAALAAFGTACGSSSPAGGSGGAGGHSGTGGTAGPADTAMFNFEGSTQNWGGASQSTDLFTSVMTSTAEKFAGSSSLAGQITADATQPGPYSLEILEAPLLTIPASTVVTFHVFVPTGAPVDFVQPYLQETDIAPMPYRFNNTYRGMGNFAMGAWTTITVTAPPDVTPLQKIGVQFHLTGPYTGPVYVDSVTW